MDINIGSFLKASSSQKRVLRKRYTLIFIFLTLCSCDFIEDKINTTSENDDDVDMDSEVEGLYQDLQGNTIRLSDFKGKKILLNFWATWCRPCVNEMPALSRAMDTLEKDNYVFLLVSDESLNKIKRFKGEHNLHLDFLKLTGGLSQMKIYALPTTFIYNENGIKVDEISGVVNWNSEQIINRLKNIR